MKTSKGQLQIPAVVFVFLAACTKYY